MDELLIYSVDNNYTTKVIYKNKPVFIIPDYRAIYNSLDKKIYCYMVDEGPSFVLDINSGVWERLFTSTNIPTRFRHHNRYFDPSDNSIYLFGGYGRHKYNNEIRKINLNENTLTDLPTDASVFYPKYLAGLGALNDTIYILGGYGSRSGNQLINPHSYYDLIGYSIKDSTLFKKFEIPHIIEDMCVANSMWIDGETRDYFALVFEKSKFNGHLQLIRGELDSPNVELVGNKIPFQFLDVRSSAGLLFMAKQKKLIAYSTYVTDSATTKTRIHTINYPPNAILEKVEDSRESKKESYLFATVGVIIIIVLIYLFFPKERAKNIIKNRSVDKDIDKSLLVNPSDILINKTDYQLIFFGGFQAINKNLEDITVHFTPLLKELFLLIWLHTFKNNKGISTEKLTEILWYDKSEKSAQNNRAVNLAKLRTLLADLGSFKLSKKTGYWKAIYNESDVKTDYVEFLKLTSSKTNLTKEKINQLIEITKKGPFLRNVQYPWLDEFKADVSEITIDTLIYYANLCHIEEDADFIIHLADSIFIFDSTNEDAMIFKCKALSLAGKHSHAKATYDKFCKEFIEMYGQEYEEPFANILKNDN
jgi:two-component SAPR family response regulator